jgi:hypothetical protein
MVQRLLPSKSAESLLWGKRASLGSGPLVQFFQIFSLDPNSALVVRRLRESKKTLQACGFLLRTPTGKIHCCDRQDGFISR